MRQLLTATLLTALTALPVTAETAQGPSLKTAVNAIWFDNWVGLSDAMLRVASPDGEIETIHEKSRPPAYRLTGSPIVDGRYRFELRAATDKRRPTKVEEPDRVDDEEPSDTEPVPFYLTGAFIVEDGRITGAAGDDEAD